MIQQASLVRDLKQLGVQEGAVLMVHASLRETGPIEGGADALIDALLEVLGPDGTLIVVLGAKEDEPFDALSTPAEEGIGVLAEVFRRRAGTVVNDHAAGRFGSQGRLARQLLAPGPLHDYHGPGSVLERFVDLGGVVLRLGAEDDTITVTHWAEYLAEVPGKRRVRLPYVRADCGEQWIESLDDTDGIVEWSGGDYFSQIWLDYLAQGFPATGPVGNCTAELFPAGHFGKFAVQWMEAKL